MKIFVSGLKISWPWLQDKLASSYFAHWLLKKFPGWYAGGFLAFFLFSLVQAIAPSALEASFSVGSILGGPENLIRQMAVQTAQYQSQTSLDKTRTYAFSSNSGAVYGWPSQGAVLSYASGSGADNDLKTQSGIVIYEVQPNEDISMVADSFRISLATIVQANNLKTTDLTPGQKLIILPVSGVLHQVQPGDTLESLSQNYNVPKFRIQAINSLSDDESLSSGEKLIIPGATMKTKLAFSELTDSSGQFRMPTIGWNWGKLHKINAVDIANRCGTPVYASASGTVLETQDTGWNNGYGAYILLSHSGKVKTRYAHLSAIFVSPGSLVEPGQLIGAIGKTGKVDGVSGCHLHFEILGAVSPFAR